VGAAFIVGVIVLNETRGLIAAIEITDQLSGELGTMNAMLAGMILGATFTAAVFGVLHLIRRRDR
jgi:NhaP-type Na+/H+ and K+/H+ antiporter